MINQVFDAAREWAALHLESIRAWTTLFFSAVAAFVGWKRYRRDSINANEQITRPWSLHRRHDALNEEDIFFHIRLDDADKNTYRLNYLAIETPRDAKIALSDFHNGSYDERSGYVPTEFQKRIEVGADMEPNVYRGATVRTEKYATYPFFVLLPPKPFWSRGATVRLRIAVEIEDISSKRTERRFCIQSQRIEWTASSAASAT